jgi:hypothetical protein
VPKKSSGFGSRFESTLAAFFLADISIAAWRWWRGAPESHIIAGFLSGVLLSVVLAAVVSGMGGGGK